MQTLHRSVRRVTLAFAAAGTLFAAAAPIAQAAPAGLVGAWSFDETSGSAVNDVSGARNNGTAANTTRTTGKNGGALNFNGSSSMVTVPDAASLDLSVALTIEAWVKPSTINGAWRTVVIKEQPANLAYALYAGDGATRPSGHVWAGRDAATQGPSSLALAKWTHLATTWDGATQRVYVNGTQVAQSGLRGTAPISGSPLRIGGNAVWGEYFSGAIDDVRVYNRALTAAEIVADSKVAVTAPAPPAPTPTPTPSPTATPAPDRTAPSVPQGLATSARTATSVTLSWNASTDNVGVTGYRVYNGDTTNLRGTTSQTTHTITGLSCGTNYQFGVTAVDAAGNESYRAAAVADTSTAACAPTPTPTPSPTATATPTATVTPAPTATASPTATPTPAPAGTTANLWVDTNGGSCARQSTPGSYADATACGSFDQAWKAASMGDVVAVRAGTYGAQTMSNRSVRGTAPGVTFRAVGGTVAVNGQMRFGEDSAWGGPGVRKADWITLIGPYTFGSLVFSHTTNITIDGFSVDKQWTTGKAVFFAGSTDKTTLRNADICCNLNTPLMETIMPGPPSDGYTPNSNITFEDAKIHDMRRNSPDVHNECFLAPAAPGLTLNRTHWYGCNVMNINIGSYAHMTAVAQTNFTWTNNIFESPTDRNENDKTGYAGFHGCNGPDWSQKPGWVLAYNIFESVWYPCPGDNGLTLRGNIGKLGSCPIGNVTYEYNVFADRACGATDKVNASIFSATNFANIAGHDWSYRSGAFQIDKGNPANAPAVDLNRRSRPIGPGPDAGPYEFGN